MKRKYVDSYYLCINKEIQGGGVWEYNHARPIHDSNKSGIGKRNILIHKINENRTRWWMDEYSLKTKDVDHAKTSRLKHFLLQNHSLSTLTLKNIYSIYTLMKLFNSHENILSLCFKPQDTKCYAL
jgi:hypothetical protein